MSLEFIVIGAQKTGTTTLWHLLRDHPQLWLPETKEAPFFSHTTVHASGWDAYLRRIGAPPAGSLLRGTVTPHYMHGWQDAPTPVVARRIAHRLPQARLVALLREPVQRARSQHAMATARGRERRDVDRAMTELLADDALRASRTAPDDTNSYVVQGEYGRVLGDYLHHFPSSALHLESSDALEREPVAVVRRILGFLGVDASYDPPHPFRRSFAGGLHPRVPERDLVELLHKIDTVAGAGLPDVIEDWLTRHSLDQAGGQELRGAVRRYLDSPIGARARERAGLEFTLRKTWNFLPASPEPISEQVKSALAAHYEADSRRLAEITGFSAPWAADPGRSA
jgi:hypothetical protein